MCCIGFCIFRIKCFYRSTTVTLRERCECTCPQVEEREEKKREALTLFIVGKEEPIKEKKPIIHSITLT